MINNYKDQAQLRNKFIWLPNPSGPGELFAYYIVARVRPKVSKGITDLLLPRTSPCLPQVVPLRSF